MTRVLAVENDLETRGMLRLLLENGEYVVLEAADGEAAMPTCCSR